MSLPAWTPSGGGVGARREGAQEYRPAGGGGKSRRPHGGGARVGVRAYLSAYMILLLVHTPRVPQNHPEIFKCSISISISMVKFNVMNT